VGADGRGDPGDLPGELTVGVPRVTDDQRRPIGEAFRRSNEPAPEGGERHGGCGAVHHWTPVIAENR
jgi:hypothetical protein